MPNKKAFLIYADLLDSVDYLSDEDLGKFFRAILYHQNKKSFEIPAHLKMGFEFLKVQFARDEKSYQEVIKSKSLAGKASAEARRLKKEAEQNSTSSTCVKSVEQNSTSSTYSTDSVSVSDSDNVTVRVNTNSLPNSLNFKTPTPRGEGFKNIGDLVGGVGKILSVIDVVGQLSGSEIQKVQSVVQGWDIEYLAKVYIDGINSGKREAPNSISKAFPAWCVKYTKGKRP